MSKEWDRVVDSALSKYIDSAFQDPTWHHYAPSDITTDSSDTESIQSSPPPSMPEEVLEPGEIFISDGENCSQISLGNQPVKLIATPSAQRSNSITAC